MEVSGRSNAPCRTRARPTGGRDGPGALAGGVLRHLVWRRHLMSITNPSATPTAASGSRTHPVALVLGVLLALVGLPLLLGGLGLGWALTTQRDSDGYFNLP